MLTYLLPSRYCEVDSELKDLAWKLFSWTQPGWARVQAVCEYVHQHIRFDYMQARATRTALEAYREQVGVCRDYTHLAITFCRCLNIPARYCTGIWRHRRCGSRGTDGLQRLDGSVCRQPVVHV